MQCSVIVSSDGWRVTLWKVNGICVNLDSGKEEFFLKFKEEMGLRMVGVKCV